MLNGICGVWFSEASLVGSWLCGVASADIPRPHSLWSNSDPQTLHRLFGLWQIAYLRFCRRGLHISFASSLPGLAASPSWWSWSSADPHLDSNFTILILFWKNYSIFVHFWKTNSFNHTCLKTCLNVYNLSDADGFLEEHTFASSLWNWTECELCVCILFKSNHLKQQLTPLNRTSPCSEAWGSLDTIEVLSRTGNKGNKGKGTSFCAAALSGLPIVGKSKCLRGNLQCVGVFDSFEFWSEVLRGFRLPQRSSKKVLSTFWLAPCLGFVQSLVTWGWRVTSATGDVGNSFSGFRNVEHRAG